MAADSSVGIAGQRRQEMIAGYTFLAPVIIVLIIFLVIPIFFTLWMSFREWGGLTPPANSTYVGVQHYIDLLTRDNIIQTDFFIAFRNTTFYAIGVVPLQTFLALLLATIANQKWLRGKGFFRTAFYFPSVTSTVAISLIFLWVYQRGGLLNQVIEAVWNGYDPINWINSPNGILHNVFAIFGLTIQTAPQWLIGSEVLGLTIWQWLSGPSVALFSIMMLNIWTTSGTLMIIFLAALQDIPPQVYEAAEVDGANSWQIFRHITVPLLRPTIFFVVTLGLIGTYQLFDQVFVMTSGGPAKTTMSLAYLIYRSGFNSSAMGVASATSVLLFIIIMTMTLIQRRIIGERGVQ